MCLVIKFTIKFRWVLIATWPVRPQPQQCSQSALLWQGAAAAAAKTEKYSTINWLSFQFVVEEEFILTSTRAILVSSHSHKQIIFASLPKAVLHLLVIKFKLVLQCKFSLCWLHPSVQWQLVLVCVFWRRAQVGDQFCWESTVREKGGALLALRLLQLIVAAHKWTATKWKACFNSDDLNFQLTFACCPVAQDEECH